MFENIFILQQNSIFDFVPEIHIFEKIFPVFLDW
jgi:hypothetical protein